MVTEMDTGEDVKEGSREGANQDHDNESSFSNGVNSDGVNEGEDNNSGVNDGENNVSNQSPSEEKGPKDQDMEVAEEKSDNNEPQLFHLTVVNSYGSQEVQKLEPSKTYKLTSRCYHYKRGREYGTITQISIHNARNLQIVFTIMG